MKTKGLIIAGFPGIGKSWAYDNYPNLKIADSDSSNFSWIQDGNKERVRNPDFIPDYMSHILEKQKTCDLVLISTHSQVLSALELAKIPHFLVYPDRGLKEAYLNRYIKRGSPKPFLELMDKSWDSFIDDVESRTKYATQVKLTKASENLSDAIAAILNTEEK